MQSSWHFNVRCADTCPFDWRYHQEGELTLILSGSGQRRTEAVLSHIDPEYINEMTLGLAAAGHQDRPTDCRYERLVADRN